MKTVTGKVINSEPISLFKATKLLSGFVSSDNCASQAVTAYLQRASGDFIELKNLHKEIRSSSSKETKPSSVVRHEQEPRVEFEEIGQEKETVNEDEIKEKKKKKNKEEDDEQREEERKEKKKKRKSDGEIGSEEKKSKKKRKSKELDD